MTGSRRSPGGRRWAELRAKRLTPKQIKENDKWVAKEIAKIEANRKKAAKAKERIPKGKVWAFTLTPGSDLEARLAPLLCPKHTKGALQYFCVPCVQEARKKERPAKTWEIRREGSPVVLSYGTLADAEKILEHTPGGFIVEVTSRRLPPRKKRKK